MARYINADALAEKKFQEPECKGFDEGVAYRCGWNDAIDAIMENEPSADVPQWIPCSERLPEEDFWAGNGLQYSEDVLITVYNSEEEKTVMDYARSMDGKWYSLTADVFIPNHWNVLAWMPLPEPYKAESEDKK